MSEEPRHLVGQGRRGVLGHLKALVPGQGLAHHRGQPVRVLEQDVGQTGGVVPGGQREDQRVPGAALDQGRGGALAAGADDQVAFPVSWHPPVGEILAGVGASIRPTVSPVAARCNRPAIWRGPRD